MHTSEIEAKARIPPFNRWGWSCLPPLQPLVQAVSFTPTREQRNKVLNEHDTMEPSVDTKGRAPTASEGFCVCCRTSSQRASPCVPRFAQQVEPSFPPVGTSGGTHGCSRKWCPPREISTTKRQGHLPAFFCCTTAFSIWKKQWRNLLQMVASLGTVSELDTEI